MQRLIQLTSGFYKVKMTKMEHVLVGVLIVISLANICLGFLRVAGRYNVHQEPPYATNDFKSSLALTVDKHFISQKIDHFIKAVGTTMRKP